METRDDINRYDPENDKVNTLNLTATRQPKVTLKMLNELKKIRTAKKAEMLKRRKVLSVVYAPPKQDDAGM